MKSKQLILAIGFIIGSISVCLGQIDREKGIELFNQGDYQNAIEFLRKAIKADDLDIASTYHLGLAYEITKQPKDSIKYFEKSITICDEIIKSVIENKYGGSINGDDKETLVDAFKKYAKELDFGYSSTQKLITLSPKDANSNKWLKRINGIYAFAPKSEMSKTFSDRKPTTPLRITKNARPAGSGNGVVRLRVLFLASGEIGYVIPVTRSKGLTEAAIDAANKIKFDPAMVDDKPVSLWKLIEYSFKSSFSRY